MLEKIFDGIFSSIPWIALGVSIVFIAHCVQKLEDQEELNQTKFMESCRNDGIQEHKCLLMWKNFHWDGK